MIDAGNPLTDPLLLLTLAAGAGTGIYALRSKLKEGSEQDGHGSAGWAEAGEYKELLVPKDATLAEGALMLGPSPWSRNKRIDIHRELSNRNVLIAGPPGSGKSRGYFLWNCAHFHGSFFASDPKFELWRYTSGFHKRARRFAPRDPDSSEAFNWIPLCGQDAHLCLNLARAVVTSESATGNSHPFFVRADTAFLAGLFAHASTFSEPTPATCYDFLTSHPGDALTEQLINSPNKIARQFATIFSQAKPELRGSIVIWLRCDARLAGR